MASDESIYEEYIEKVNLKRLSTIRNIVITLMDIISDPKATARDLQEVILKDPPLTARLLSHVNSAFHGPTMKFSDIEEAIIWIGFEKLKELALTQTICELFTSANEYNGYSRSKLWRHSQSVALLSRNIARREFGNRGTTLYTAGLLHELGIILLDQFFHEKFIEVLSEYDQAKNDFAGHLRESFGICPFKFASLVMKRAGFPQKLYEIIEAVETPAQTSEQHRKEAHILHIAEMALIYHPGFKVDVNNLLLPKAEMDSLKITPESVQMLAIEVEEFLSQPGY